MKQIFALLVLVVLNIAVFAYASEGSDTIAVAEAVATDTTATMECFSGGPSSPSCSVPSGIKIGNETSVGCSVSCMEGYYACCGVRCICLPNDSIQ